MSEQPQHLPEQSYDAHDQILNGFTLLTLDLTLDPTWEVPRSLYSPYIVSIHLEVKSNPLRITQIGIATLDTSSLSQHGAFVKHISPIGIESHYCHAVLENKRCFSYPPAPRCPSNVPEGYVEEGILTWLKSLLTKPDKDGNPMNTILVGHDIYRDLRLLKDMANIDIIQLPSISSVIDIQDVAIRLFSPGSTYMPLKDVMRYVEVPIENIDSPGSNALYTLKALFCM